jgi:hypothetical protein
MKSLLVTIAVLCAGCGAALAQAPGGTVALYSDAGYSDCTLPDIEPSVQSVYVVHKNTAGAASVQFRVVTGGDFTGVYVGHATPFSNVLGDPLSGFTVGYEACLSSDILVTTMTWSCSGDSPPCAWLEVVASSGQPDDTVLAVDCSGASLAGEGAVMSVNPVPGVCLVAAGCIKPLPVERTTWGHVKALYQ